MNLTQTTSKLIQDLQTQSLTRSSLWDYYNQILRNFGEIQSFQSESTFQYASLLLTTILDDDGFRLDSDQRQTMATLAYYIVSKGLFEKIYDENRLGIADPHKSVELCNLLGVRLSILETCSQSINYSLKVSSVMPLDKNWSPYSGSSSDTKFFNEMRIYDAYVIDDRARGSEGYFINQGSKQISRDVLNEFSEYIPTYINESMMKGFGNHKMFFEYLENRFEKERDFDFS